MQKLNISQMISDHSQNIALFNDRHLLHWGWPLCTRTTYRFLEHYEKIPRIVRAIQRFTPFFNNGKIDPVIEATFSDKVDIKQIGMGCGYVGVLDSKGRVFLWGDNYAVSSLFLMKEIFDIYEIIQGQLGTGDDIHREEPT